MRLFILAVVLGLAACSGSVALNYYHLPAVSASDRQQTVLPVLYIAPVQVASYLNGRGLVLQLSDVELNMARQHLWAEPLTTQVQRQLRDLLASAAPYSIELSAQPGAVMLTLYLDRFHGTTQGSAIVSGRYQLSTSKNSVPFNISAPLAADGYPALVIALAEGLQQLSAQIAADLPAVDK